MSPVTGAARRVGATAAFLVGAATLAFGVVAPPEHCPEITTESARAAAAAAVGWIADNQRPDGTWLYEYDRGTDTTSTAYNVVRHAGVLSSLYQAAGRGYEGAWDSAERGLAWATDHLVTRGDWTGLTDSDSVQAGANALLIAALAERRDLTGDTTYDHTMAGLARFVVQQTEPSGALLAYYDLEPARPRPGTYSVYYTGEAQWALARMHLAFPDAGWGPIADRMLHYIATERDDAEGIWPPLADHWSGYGLASTAAFPDRPAGRPLTDAEVDLLRRQAGLIGQRVRAISQRFGPWGPLVRGTFTPRGGGYGVFGEGLAGLWRAAQLDERLAPERATLAARAACIAGLAVEAQTTDDEAAAYPDPGKVAGAWFVGDTTRMDDQQHAVSALMLTMPLLDVSPDAVPDAIHPAPVWLLWALVVVAGVNPIRVALAAPVGRHRARLVGTGTALGAFGVLAIGATSGALLDALDVSRPAMRLAGAALCLLAAGIDVVRPLPGTDGALAGSRAAIVPVALPLTIRPTLAIAGLSVVADHGLAFYGAALLVVVGASAVVATVPSAVATGDDASRGVSRLLWLVAARGTAAIAFAASALLVAHAVFDL